MTKKEKFEKLLSIRPRYFDERKQQWIGTLSYEEAEEEVKTLLKEFDIYKNEWDSEFCYATDEALPTDRTGKRYVYYNRRYYTIFQYSIISYGYTGKQGKFVKVS